MREADAQGSRFYCRQIRLTDWPAVARLNRMRGGEQLERTILERHAPFDGAVCMAERGGPVIGWCGYLNSYRTLKKAPGDGFLLLYMATHPEWERLDVMRAIVDHLKAVAKLAGVPRVFSILPASSAVTVEALFQCGMLLERDVAPNGDELARMSCEIEAA